MKRRKKPTPPIPPGVPPEMNHVIMRDVFKAPEFCRTFLQLAASLEVGQSVQVNLMLETEDAQGNPQQEEASFYIYRPNVVHSIRYKF